MFKTKCPRCGKTEINKINASMGTQIKRIALVALFPPAALFVGFAKPQMVCVACGFTWQKK